MNETAINLLTSLMTDKLDSKEAEIRELKVLIRKQAKLINVWMNENSSPYLPLAMHCPCSKLDIKYCLCDM
jgi:hypothetical protein